MALSNRDRVNAGFEILAIALDDFFTRTVKVDDSSTWINLLEMVDLQKGRRNEHYSRTDPQCSLRFLTEGTTGKVRSGWYPLSQHITRADEALASELRQTRNEWAHNKAFNPDDTYRALDTMERLIAATGNKPAAAQLAERKAGIRVVQERRATVQREQEMHISVGGDSIPPWRELITPHPDVADGTFNPSGFAADLHTVANPAHVADPTQVSASAEYTDPQQFFDRTYLTEGLRDLLSRALRRLSGDSTASPVINLQTNFGGGKTHSLLAVWHIFGGLRTEELPQDMIDLLNEEQVQAALSKSGGEIPEGVRRVALVGTNLSASGNMTMPDGTVVQTMWGHLAWQLGGKEGYEIIKEDDLNGTNPGAKLRILLDTFGPAIILIDEWVAYARQLVSNDRLAGGTLSTQQSFAQALGEAVTASPNSMLFVSIPASAEMAPGTYVDSHMDDEEIGGADGREALVALLQVINRQAEQWRPAGAAESFEIVRRRIFQEIPDDVQVKIEASAEVMRRFYEKNSKRFPYDATRADYKTKIARCYPIHPELFDRLYEDWATLPRFQRTRGVLRLMSIIVHHVWRSNDAAPFIMPSSIPLKNSSVANELTQYLDDDWKSVISVDVDGRVPHGIDDENPLFGARHVSTRLARTVFLGSAPRTKNSGIEEHYVNLGTALPGDKIGNFHSALNALANKSSHFYESDGHFWFDTSANITSVVREREEALSEDDLFEEIENRLHNEVKDWSRTKNTPLKVIVAPNSSADIPDMEDVRLVIVPPSVTKGSAFDSTDAAHDYVVRTTSYVGENQARSHKNSLVFLAADRRRISELTDGVRKYLAWSAVRDSANKLDLTTSQIDQAKQNAEKWDTTVTARLAESYQWVLIPVESSPTEKQNQIFVSVEAQKISSGQQIISRALEKLATLDVLQHSQAAKILEHNISAHLASTWQDPGYIALGDLWGMHTKYLYMPRLANRTVLEEGIRNTHHREMLDDEHPFALADSVDSTSDGLIFLNLRWQDSSDLLGSPALPDSLLLVNSSLALEQFDREIAAREARQNKQQDSSPGHSPASENPDAPSNNSEPEPISPEPKPEATSLNTTYYGTFPLEINSAPSLFMRIDDEILSHYRDLTQQGAKVTLRLDVKVVHDDGIPDTIQKMTYESTQELPGGESEFE